LIRNCSAYNQLMTSHKLGWLAGSRRTLLHMQQRAAARCHGRSYEKSDSVNQSIFSWRTIPSNFIPIRFETTQP